MSRRHSRIQKRETNPMVKGAMSAAVAAVVLVGMSGCKNPNRPGRYRSPAATSAASTTLRPTPAPAAPTVAAKSTKASPASAPPVSAAPAGSNRVQLVDQETAKRMGLRTSWQQRIPSRGSGGVKQVIVAGEDVVVVDRLNAMTVFEAANGKTLWHEAPIPPREVIFGVDRVDLDGEDLLIVTTDTDLYVVGADTGLQVSRQNLAQIPSTGAIMVGEDIIYGTARGRLVWHNYPVGYELKANGLGSGIAGRPVRLGNRIGANSVKGRVGVFDSGSAKRIWTRQVNAGFKHGPTMTRDAVYCADTGQRVACFDLDSGSPRWKYFSATELTASPVALGDRIIQQAGEGGMLCLAAMPSNSPQGKLIWRNPSMRGEVVTVLGNDILVWDADQRLLSMVDSNNGSIVEQFRLDNVDAMQVATDVGSGRRMLLASNRNGRIQRLDPRN